MTLHCPPDTGFKIQALAVWGRACFKSVTEAPTMCNVCAWAGNKRLFLWNLYITAADEPAISDFPGSIWVGNWAVELSGVTSSISAKWLFTLGSHYVRTREITLRGWLPITTPATQYCGEPPWPKCSVLGLRPPEFAFRILCLEWSLECSVISLISPSSGGSYGPF